MLADESALYLRFRGTPRLPAEAARERTVEILRGSSVTNSMFGRDGSSLIDDLVVDGFAEPSDAYSGEGYRQILSLFCGTLLRLAGARIESVRAEVLGRDSARLEALAQAILARLSQAREMGEPHEDPADDQGAVALGSSPVTARPAPVISIPGMRSPFSARVETPIGVAVTSESENPPLAFLRELLDDGLIRAIRNLSGGMQGGPSASSVPTAGSDTAKTAFMSVDVVQAAIRAQAPERSVAREVRLDLSDGVSCLIRADVVEKYRGAPNRAELIRALARALEGMFS